MQSHHTHYSLIERLLPTAHINCIDKKFPVSNLRLVVFFLQTVLFLENMDDIIGENECLEKVMRNQHAEALDYISTNMEEIIRAVEMILNFVENDEIPDQISSQ